MSGPLHILGAALSLACENALGTEFVTPLLGRDPFKPGWANSASCGTLEISHQGPNNKTKSKKKFTINTETILV